MIFLEIVAEKGQNEIDLFINNFKGEGAYYILDDNTATFCPSYNIIAQNDTLQKGIINIYKFDRDKHIISGSFSFVAITLDGNVFNITEGQFDIKF